jgi:hypothetical protein
MPELPHANAYVPFNEKMIPIIWLSGNMDEVLNEDGDWI